SCQQVCRQIARPHIHPSVFVDLASKKLATVRTLFTKDLSPLIKLHIVDQQCPSLPARKILCLMKTESSKLPHRTEISSTISSIKAMRIVFDHCDGSPPRHCHDCIHFAPDARVMHNTNRLRTRGNASFDLALVDV